MTESAFVPATAPSLRARVFRQGVRLMIRPIFARQDLSVEQRRRKLLRLTTMAQFTIPKGTRFRQAPLGGVPAEWTDPPGETRGVLLYLHGGAYVVGAPQIYRELTARFARDAQVCVATLDYRLAPEHPFPAAVDDAVAAYRALLDNTPASRIVVAGDSAGGGLSLALLQRLREEGLPMPAGAALLSPWGDLSGSLPAYTREADREPLLYVPTLRECAVNYAGETPLEHPQLSPIHADYQGLPPLLIQATDAEVLADDARRIAERAQAGGVEVRLEMWTGLWHVWQLFAGLVPEAGDATARMGRWLGSRLS